MNEYTIVRIDNSDFSNGNYEKLLKVFKKENLSVIKTTTYTEENSVIHFDLVDISTKYLVMLVGGFNAKLKSKLIVQEFNTLKKDKETFMYASSIESFDLDVAKYFNGTIENTLSKRNNIESISNNVEQTLAIIKPDGIKNKKEILKMITDSGLVVRKFKITTLSTDILRQHYSHVVDAPFYPNLEEYMQSGPVIIMILEGENAVNKLRDLMGPTDSRKALPNTIRGKFGTDITRNAIHGSDSLENAKIEIDRFFKQKQKVLK